MTEGRDTGTEREAARDKERERQTKRERERRRGRGGEWALEVEGLTEEKWARNNSWTCHSLTTAVA